MPKLARRIDRATPSAIMAISDQARRLKAEGRDVISFSIGVPNFRPGAHVYAAAREAVDHDSGQYGSNRGRADLLDAFISRIRDLGLNDYRRENCVVGVGAKQILYNLAEALLDEGDEVIFPAPYWTSYLGIVNILGARVTALACPRSQNYKLLPEQLDRALSSRPRLFIFNNPANPTGMVYTQEEIRALGDVLVRHPDTWIITDDIYHEFVFDGIGYHNFLHSHPQLRDRLIFVDSLSKTYSMPGWRVGFAAAPVEVAKAVTTLNSNHITSLPEVVTAAAVAALTGPQDIPAAQCAEFARRRDEVVRSLSGISDKPWPIPQGAFYAFPDVSCAFGKRAKGGVINSDVDFCMMLLNEKAVACVPGSAFGEPNAVRISYTCPAEQLQPGLQRMVDFFHDLG